MDAIFTLILSFFSDISRFITDFWLFLTSGIYEIFAGWFASFVIYSTVASLKFKLFMVTFAWDVAKQILNQLNISAVLASAWSSIDSRLLNMLTFFNIPDVINIILSARVTRFVLNFMGM